VLADSPYNQASDDFNYFQGCNLLHKHKYEEALSVFCSLLLNKDDTLMKERFLFNEAYAIYKLDDNDERCLEIWRTEITDADPCIKLMANLNLAIVSYINDLRDNRQPEIG
jgi:hypothetical protein